MHANSMLMACYAHAMSAIQVKNVPEDLHDRLRARARAEGRSMSDYVLYVLERDLALPTTREWLEQLKRSDTVTDVSREDILAALHEGREERDEQILAALSSH
jgi:plasmid stability protein